MTPQTQDVALRSAIPPELRDAGVTIDEDESGYRRIVFPETIKERFNVLLPVSEIVRADPNWTPVFRAAHIDVETETYVETNAPKGTRSLNKLGLFKLCRVAGLARPVTRRMPVSELGEGKIGWQATVVVRRSDGTEEPVTQSKIVDIEVERQDVRAGVKAGMAKNGWTPEVAASVFERRWLNEQKHMEAKCETKAVERAVRAALLIPHTFPEKRLALPFLVASVSFTPDTSDPEVRRLVIEAGLSARTQLYPSGPAPQARPELEASPEQEPPAEETDAAGTGTPEPEKAGSPPPAPAASQAPQESTGSTGSTEAAFGGEEPGVGEQTSFTAPEGAVDPEVLREGAAAGEVMIRFGKKHPGRTIREIDEEHGDQSYILLIAGPKFEAKNDDARRAKSAAQTYARIFLGWEG